MTTHTATIQQTTSSVSSVNSVRYFYLRDENRAPFGCVAVGLDKGAIVCAFSLCHKNDEFNKLRARMVALIRLTDNVKSYYAGDIQNDSVDGDNLRILAFNRLLRIEGCDRLKRAIRAELERDAQKASRDLLFQMADQIKDYIQLR